MSDITKVVSTVFRTVDHASAPMQLVANSALRTSSALTSAIGPLGALIGGLSILGTIYSISQLGSEFETTQNAIAGTLSSLGVSSDFNAGLRDAASTMNAITVAAAALPGEAEDYVAVFRAALPQVQNAIGGTVADMYGFTNRLTAIGRTFGIDAQQIGNDANRMLMGHASESETRTFASMLPFMRQVQGQANLTAQSFNRMTSPQRAQLLNQTFARLQPMLDNAANSFDAMWGGFQSNGRLLLRMGSAPLFDGMKNTLRYVNNLLMDSNGHMTQLGQSIVRAGNLVSSHMVNAFGNAFKVVESLGSRVQSVLMGRGQVPPWVRQTQALIGNVMRVGGRLANNRSVNTAVAGAGARAYLGAAGPIGMAIGPLLAFAQNTQAVTATLTPLISILNGGVSVLGPLLELVGMVNDGLGGILAGVLPGLASGLAMIATPLQDFAMGLITIGQEALNDIIPHLTALGGAIGEVFSAVGTFLAPILRLMGMALLEIARTVMTYLRPALNMLADALTWAFRKIAEGLRWLGHRMASGLPGAGAGMSAMPNSAGSGNTSALDRLLASLTRQEQTPGERAAEASARRAARRQTPTARGGGNTNFINNRFDITQKFEDGFDPDRILVAFTEDLERTATRRLQSGLEPAFAIR